MSRNSFAGAVAALAFLTACRTEQVTVSLPGDIALVTMVNATPTVSNPHLGTTRLNPANLQPAGWLPSCARIPQGSQVITFKQLDTTKAPVATPATNFTAGQRYTAILATDGTTPTAFVLPETFVPVTSDSYGVRFLNATGQAGDIYVTADNLPIPAATPPDVSALATNTATGGATGVDAYLKFPVTRLRVRFFDVGNITTPRVNYVVDTRTWTMGVTVVFTKTASGAFTVIQSPPVLQCQP